LSVVFYIFEPNLCNLRNLRILFNLWFSLLQFADRFEPSSLIHLLKP
jgi:hypothetical protein